MEILTNHIFGSSDIPKIAWESETIHWAPHERKHQHLLPKISCVLSNIVSKISMKTPKNPVERYFFEHRMQWHKYFNLYNNQFAALESLFGRYPHFGNGSYRTKIQHGWSRMNPLVINLIAVSFMEVVVKANNRKKLRICVGFSGCVNCSLLSLLFARLCAELRDLEASPYEIYYVYTGTDKATFKKAMMYNKFDYGVFIHSSFKSRSYATVSIFGERGLPVCEKFENTLNRELNYGKTLNFNIRSFVMALNAFLSNNEKELVARADDIRWNFKIYSHNRKFYMITVE